MISHSPDLMDASHPRNPPPSTCNLCLDVTNQTPNEGGPTRYLSRALQRCQGHERRGKNMPPTQLEVTNAMWHPGPEIGHRWKIGGISIKEEVATFFYQEPIFNSKYLWLCNPRGLLGNKSTLHCSSKAKTPVNEWAWLSSNETSQVRTGSGLAVACALGFLTPGQ